MQILHQQTIHTSQSKRKQLLASLGIMVLAGIAGLALDFAIRHDGIKDGYGWLIYAILGVCGLGILGAIWVLIRATRMGKAHLAVQAEGDATHIVVATTQGLLRVADIHLWTVWESRVKTDNGGESRMLNLLLIDEQDSWIGLRSPKSANPILGDWQFHPPSLKTVQAVFTAKELTMIVRILQQRHGAAWKEYFFVNPYAEDLAG